MVSSCALLFVLPSGLVEAGADVPVVCAAAKPLLDSTRTMAAMLNVTGIN
jgi:hypothetical protein